MSEDYVGLGNMSDLKSYCLMLLNSSSQKSI